MGQDPLHGSRRRITTSAGGSFSSSFRSASHPNRGCWRRIYATRTSTTPAACCGTGGVGESGSPDRENPGRDVGQASRGPTAATPPAKRRPRSPDRQHRPHGVQLLLDNRHLNQSHSRPPSL
jgi:hypothetical protein